MRYFFKGDTLFIRGRLRVTGAEISGIRPVSTILCRTSISPTGTPAGYSGGSHPETLADPDTPQVVVAASPANLCVVQYDLLTIFSLAGKQPGTRRLPGVADVALIICYRNGLDDTALRSLERSAMAEIQAGIPATLLGKAGYTSPSLLVAAEGEAGAGVCAPQDMESGVHEAILKGIAEAIARARGSTAPRRPSFFIFSRFRGEHWVEWCPEDCQYYPCHFPGQSCAFCYCPLYPCGDETLGEWAESSGGGRVWNCARCRMIHEPAIARYFAEHPEATLEELVRVRNSVEG